MHLTESDTEHARVEAWRTYREYGRLRQLHRDDRANAVLTERLDHLRGRYAELERQLFGPPATSEEVQVQYNAPIDVEELKALSTRPNSAFSRTSLHTEPSEPVHLFRTGKIIRFSVSFALLLAALLVLFLVQNQDLGFYVVPSSSMEPTLLPNDRLIAYFSEGYKRGDVVVVRDPDYPGGNLVKRIVGLPGDEIAIRNASLIVNGVPVREPYLKEEMVYKMDPVRLGRSEVFLLGDNRNRSHDSHIWKRGVPVSSILGSVRAIYSPRTRLRAQITYTDVFSDVNRKLGRADTTVKAEPIS